ACPSAPDSRLSFSLLFFPVVGVAPLFSFSAPRQQSAPDTRRSPLSFALLLFVAALMISAAADVAALSPCFAFNGRLSSLHAASSTPSPSADPSAGPGRAPLFLFFFPARFWCSPSATSSSAAPEARPTLFRAFFGRRLALREGPSSCPSPMSAPMPSSSPSVITSKCSS
ncbi:hypothetical protein Vafri_17173, partial [Volvox africanus]